MSITVNIRLFRHIWQFYLTRGVVIVCIVVYLAGCQQVEYGDKSIFYEDTKGDFALSLRVESNPEDILTLENIVVRLEYFGERDKILLSHGRPLVIMIMEEKETGKVHTTGHKDIGDSTIMYNDTPYVFTAADVFGNLPNGDYIIKVKAEVIVDDEDYRALHMIETEVAYTIVSTIN